MIKFPLILTVGLGSMLMVEENTEVGTNQPKIDSTIDNVVDTQWMRECI